MIQDTLELLKEARRTAPAVAALTEKEKNAALFAMADALEAELGVSASWLLYGTGEMVSEKRNLWLRRTWRTSTWRASGN